MKPKAPARHSQISQTCILVQAKRLKQVPATLYLRIVVNFPKKNQAAIINQMLTQVEPLCRPPDLLVKKTQIVRARISYTPIGVPIPLIEVRILAKGKILIVQEMPKFIYMNPTRNKSIPTRTKVQILIRISTVVSAVTNSKNNNTSLVVISTLMALTELIQRNFTRIKAFTQ